MGNSIIADDLSTMIEGLWKDSSTHSNGKCMGSGYAVMTAAIINKSKQRIGCSSIEPKALLGTSECKLNSIMDSPKTKQICVKKKQVAKSSFQKNTSKQKIVAQHRDLNK